MNKRILQHIIFSMVVFFIFICLSEAACRYFSPDAMSFKKIKFHNETSSFKLFKKDFCLGWALKPEANINFCGVNVKTNSLGMRCPEPNSNPDLCLLFLGDSSTFGWGVEQNKTYPYLVLDIIKKKYPQKSINIINTAVPGYTSFHGKIITDKYFKKFNPDFTIICLSNNEYEHATLTLSEEFKKRLSFAFIKKTLLSPKKAGQERDSLKRGCHG